MYKVAVLLAAYNGRKWIEEQINSILEQKNVLVTVFISVDSSNDSTESYVTALSQEKDNIVILPLGFKFGGAAKNFYRLLKDVDFSGFNFISLADQDDIWHLNKLERAVKSLNDGHEFYSCNVNAFWPDGKVILIDKAQKQVEYDHYFEAAGPGCTYVFNTKVAKDLQVFILNNTAQVSEVTLHDWFIYAYARTRKHSWFIDKKPCMEYRQHSSNQVGANVNFLAAFKRMKLIRNKWFRNQIEKIYKTLNCDNRFMNDAISKKYAGNIHIMKNICKVRRRPRDRFFLFVICLFNFF